MGKKREHIVWLYLNDEENDRLNRISAEHCMRRGDVLRALITGTELIRPPDRDLREVRRSLDRIESEAEMLAYLAARDGICIRAEGKDGEEASESLLTALERILECLDEIRIMNQDGG